MTERDDTQRSETEHPHNPPRAVANRSVRRAALLAYLGPIVVIAIVLGIALLYWERREPGHTPDNRGLSPTGTTGDTVEDQNGTQYPQSGGGDPAARPARTADELKEKGAGR